MGKPLNLEDAKCYNDYQKMLEKERLDFMDIAVPHFLHKEILIAYAQARVNINYRKTSGDYSGGSGFNVGSS